MDVNDLFQNKYGLVKGAARRARQLQSSASSLGISTSSKACRMARDEIRNGTVTYSLSAKKSPLPPMPPQAV